MPKLLLIDRKTGKPRYALLSDEAMKKYEAIPSPQAKAVARKLLERMLAAKVALGPDTTPMKE